MSESPETPMDVLRRFNDTAVDFGALTTVVDAVVHHALATPDALAVADGDGSLTYAELDARAAELAAVLRASGAQRERCIAMCLQASVSYVVGALAVLKAGAAYVPIDPDYPRERIELILGDTDPVAVLVDHTTPAAVLSANATRAIDLDRPWPDVPSASTHAVTTPDPSSLAYVVYTSGSTGRPKGVEIEHRALANLVHAQAYASGTTSGDRLAQTAAPAFDATVMEVWHPLAAGASLHIAPHELRRDPRKLVEWFIEQRITMSMVPTALVSLLFDSGHLYRQLTVRRLSTGGAALLTRPAEDAAFPLVNMYGPTETTVVATQCVIPPVAQGAPKIGRPLANTRAYILDADRQPVGLDVSGEIWLGGAQVARGYRGRPDLTAERFCLDPFSDVAGARMYRTGDLGAWMTDGRIDFRGRVDDQIAIRGYRIEPGEVENALSSMPGVIDAAVVAVDHGRRGQQLAAYYTADEPAPSTAAVRAHLRDILPEYMVPTAYQRLSSFPLTPNGKVDRKGLPAPVIRRDDIDGAYRPAGNESERRAAEVFARILELDKVGVNDDFFALGGDSLDAVECTVQLEKALGTAELPVQTLYAHPTVADLVAVLDAGVEHVPDWAAEIRGGAVGPIDPVSPTTSRPRAILLTGASGFLGPHLLASLVARTRDSGAHVMALVRAPDVTRGTDRLRAALLAERRDLGTDWERVEVVVGDLALPRFGWDDDTFDAVAGRLDAVVHNGARVHHLDDYWHLKAPNVDGTSEVLRLAARAGGAPLRYVSSMSTGLDVVGGELVERPDVSSAAPPGGGYAESKWVAERIVVAARQSGLPAQAVRLPRAMAALRSGATSTTDAAVRLLRGCIELRVYPQWSGWEPWSPVDLVADALVDGLTELNESSPAIAYPTAAVAGLVRVFRAAADFGYPLEPLPMAAWRERLALAEDNPARPVAAEFGLLRDADALAFGDVPPGRAWRMTPLLPGPAAPPIDPEYVWRMLDFLISVGYLPRPPR